MSYFSIHIPSKADSDDEGGNKALVFTDFEEALKVWKTHKDARLKTFKNSRDAVKFSQVGFESCPLKSSDLKSPSAAAAAAEKAPFRAPTKQELIQFRKAIEDNKYDLVAKTIWDNPRYLVNVGDTPTSLKDGTRYNALHVCAIHKRPRIAEFILKTISKVHFIELLHGKKNEKVCQEVCDILLDYYLNMPEKGRSETPLHLAVKFGAVDVVEVLTAYPECKMTVNLDKMTPKEIICSRVNDATEETKEKIATLLDERFYVPVIRSVDNSLPPTIGEPFSITSPPVLNKDPLSPIREIQAVAGPMNQEQAKNFRRRWKTPPRVSNPNITITNTSLSPLKFPMFSTPQKQSENNNSPLSTKSHSASKLFPNKSADHELEDNHNGNYQNSSNGSEEHMANNSNTKQKPSSFILNTPLRRLKKDLFFTYRDQGNSPLVLEEEAGTPTQKANNSTLLENGVFVDSPLKERHLKLSDTEKGLEVIGRELAREQQIDWKEHWDFLGCFVDISSPDGLVKLENYLKERRENDERQEKTTSPKTAGDFSMDDLCNALNSIFKRNTNEATNTPSIPTYKLAENKKVMETTPSTTNHTNQPTAPYLCVEKSLQVFAKRMTKTILHNLESVVSINDAFNSELKRLKSLVCSFKDDARFIGVNFNLVHSRFANLIVQHLKNSENLENETIVKIEKCFQQILDARKRACAEKTLKLQLDKKEQLQCVSEVILDYLMSMDDQILPENMRTEQICIEVWEKEKECICHWENAFSRRNNRRKRLEFIHQNCNNNPNYLEDDQNYEKNNSDDFWENAEDSSNDNSDADDDAEIFWSDAGSEESDHDFYTPPESPSMLEQDIQDELFESYRTYLLGDEPTKRDLDVINALFNTEINRETYPNIHHWRAAVLRHSLEERDNFPSPSVIVKRHTARTNSERLTIGRRLFSSPNRLNFATNTKLVDLVNGDVKNVRVNSVSSNSSFSETSPLNRSNLSLTFMNVSEI